MWSHICTSWFKPHVSEAFSVYNPKSNIGLFIKIKLNARLNVNNLTVFAKIK
jgi:hypothetical protein